MIDFHMHSTFSDGTLTPLELVNKAVEIGLSAISLTDHDTTDGLSEFFQSAEGKPIKIMSGVEMAGNWNMREIHILGFWIDKECSQLQEVLKYTRENRDRRNFTILEKLNAKGFEITYEEMLNESKGDVIGRPHIASLLVKKGYFKTNQDVFSSCLARGSDCYVLRVIPEAKDVIDVIHKSGGIAIWAHPLHRNKRDIRNIKTDIMSLVNLGLDGIEAYYPQFSAPQHKALLKCAEEINLAISGGTDFHGDNQPGISLGTGHGDSLIPDKIYDDLLEYRNRKNSK